MEKNVSPDIYKVNSFHFIRTLCCLIVVYEHSIGLSNLTLINFDIRNIAVYVFFILSGFWVSISYVRNHSLIYFYVKRIKKIYPQYFIVVCLSAVLLVFFTRLTVYDYFTSMQLWKYIGVNLMVANFLQPNLPGVFENCALNGAVNGSLWTIKIEIGFYLILPFILRILLNKNVKKYIRLCLFIIIYVVSMLYPIVCKKIGLPETISHQLPAFMRYFIMGVAVFIFWDVIYKNINKLIIPATICMCLSFTTLSLTIVTFWIAYKCVFFSKIITTDYSYSSIYLVHFPIIQILNTSNIFVMHPIFVIILVIGMSFSLSYILSKLQRKIK